MYQLLVRLRVISLFLSLHLQSCAWSFAFLACFAQRNKKKERLLVKQLLVQGVFTVYTGKPEILIGKSNEWRLSDTFKQTCERTKPSYMAYLTFDILTRKKISLESPLWHFYYFNMQPFASRFSKLLLSLVVIFLFCFSLIVRRPKTDCLAEQRTVSSPYFSALVQISKTGFFRYDFNFYKLLYTASTCKMLSDLRSKF